MSENDGDSWEDGAAAAGNLMGHYCTWPPQSYTCTFCQREFRSSQALGGHMNVHRQDRARLLQLPPPPLPAAVVKAPTTIGQEFLGNGLCLFYPLANHDNVLTPAVPMDFPFPCLPITPEPSSSSMKHNDEGIKGGSSFDEELDLELRLGPR